MTLILIRLHKKADSLETNVNYMKDRKVRADKKSFDLGKNGCHRPSGLGGRSIVVVSQ